MNNKVKSLKINQIKSLVNDLLPMVKAQFLRDLGPMAAMDGLAVGDSLMIGGCVYLNYLACQKLVENGYNATLKAGRATFGVSKAAQGVLEFGYNGNMATLMPNGEVFEGQGFKGHCWVEIKNLGLIVDFTLSSMKQHFIVDNANRGIDDNTYSLNQNKVIVSMDETLSRNQIVAGGVGYHYASNAAITAQANELLAEVIYSSQMARYL